MNLKEYTKKIESRKSLAKKIGKDKRYLDQLIYGAKPSSFMALKIEDATNGMVHHDTLLFPELCQNLNRLESKIKPRFNKKLSREIDYVKSIIEG